MKTQDELDADRTRVLVKYADKMYETGVFLCDSRFKPDNLDRILTERFFPLWEIITRGIIKEQKADAKAPTEADASVEYTIENVRVDVAVLTALKDHRNRLATAAIVDVILGRLEQFYCGKSE